MMNKVAHLATSSRFSCFFDNKELKKNHKTWINIYSATGAPSLGAYIPTVSTVKALGIIWKQSRNSVNKQLYVSCL